MAQWWGWARVAGRWERLCGPVEGLGAAARSLADEVRRRGLVVPPRQQVLTKGAEPPAETGRRPRPGARQKES
jgi:hypothetical protein